jgi:nucleoside-diphosphate-sugar epimerase
MRVLVIGGTRFIGRHAVRALVDRGCEVTVFHRGITEPDDLADVEHLHGDRRELPQRRDAVSRVDPHVVVDMIPLTEADARGLVRAVAGITSRIVAISSQDVYRAYDVVRGRDPGPPQPIPLTEESELRREWFPYRATFPADHPLHDYDKIPVEQGYLGTSEIAATVLRLPAVYGPHDAQHRTAAYVQRMRDGRPVILVAESLAPWRWTRSYVEDVAAAVALAVTDERASGRIYNVGAPRAMSEVEWISWIGRALDWYGEIRVVPDTDLPEAMLPELNPQQHLVVDSSRIREELGFGEVVDPADAMVRTVSWEADQEHEPIDYTAEDAALLRRDHGPPG